MRDTLGESLRNIKWIKVRKHRLSAVLLVLSFVVSMDVFWILRQPGLTLAGDASCGIREHKHSEECFAPEETEGQDSIYTILKDVHLHEYERNSNYTITEDVHLYEGEQNLRKVICGLQEHVHSIDCYSDESADVETLLDWQEMFADYPFTGVLREDLVGIAKTQVGYSESERNFEVGDDGVRRGYTRYGAWYGTPYRDWSAMFVSFCLSYAGADPDEFPGNTGAASMAELWKNLGQYVPVGEYVPVSGDLVFFGNNTVGIVTEVQNATFYVIRGDMDGAVRGEALPLEDETITGWGLTDVPREEGKTPLEEIDILDISNGPAVFLFVGDGGEPQIKHFSLRGSRSAKDLLSYLETNGGSYFYTLLDKNNQEIPKDAEGNYIAEANEEYKLTITFNSPEGFMPGTYQYQVPNGLMVDGGEGSFVLKDGTNVGSWIVTDTGLITLDFNENLNSLSDITISATMGINFPEQDDPIDFDGLITVTVKPPVQQQYPTVLSKWGSPNQENGKINWSIRIDGYADSQIPGNILTDQVALSDWSRPHSYTESDIAGGLSFGVSDPNGGWHDWHVSADDPHLIWGEDGWSYKIPKTVICDYCGELELGNEGWVYYINYTSTPTKLNASGTFDYENKVTVDGQTAWGWSNFNHGQITAEIIKDGSFVSDAGGGAFLWEVQATIPGRIEGQRAEYSWFISDEMRLVDGSGTIVSHVQNDAHLSLVTATYNGETIRIPRIQDATDSDMFAWDNAWTATENGISHTRNINLLCRCQCTPETCHWTGCGDYWFQNDDGTWATKGFCQCWTETQNMTFSFVYKTTDLSMIESYGALGYQVNNHAQLFYVPDGTSVRVSYDDASVTVPNLFEKKLTNDFDGYTAHYKITVNEAKLVMTDGSPLTIHDVMTETLAYIGGSLVITTEDAVGNRTTLRQGEDFTVAYDGTGNETDANGNSVHVLDIVILHPQPVMYILDYDTTLIMPDQVTGGLKYSNSATITLWGESLTDPGVEKVYADFNIAAKTYKVELYKTCALTGKPLGGAIFGLYNARGGLITTDVTDANGELLFQTNIIEGIVLREHVLYYMQELKAPPGYQLDDTKYWFCFCNDTGDHCEKCVEVMAGTDAARIPEDEIGKIPVVNQLISYDLPATGGSGIYPFVLAGVILIVTPLVCGFIRRRKQERRGVG